MKLETYLSKNYIFRVKLGMPAPSLRTRITAVVVLILFATGLLITYFNSIATEQMLFRDAESSAHLIAAEFNLATRSTMKINTMTLEVNARLALRLLHEAEFIAFFQRVGPDSLRLVASAGTRPAEAQLAFVRTTLVKDLLKKSPVSSVRHGNTVFSYSVLLRDSDQVWGYAVTEVTLRSVRQTVRRSQVIGATITLAVSVFASFLLLFAMRLTFLRSFGDLEEAMQEAAGGNMGVRLSLTSGAEFRTLSSIYNKMMTELQRAHEISQSEVKRQEEYNDRLKREIAVATESLREKSDEIMSMQEKLRLFESQASLGKVASKLAHELGSPLNAIYTSVQLMMENNIAENSKKKLKVIERQVETMIGIINRSLQARKIAMPSKQRVVLKNLIEETKLVMDPKLREKSVGLTVWLDNPMAVVNVDAVQIQQVLINLLNNSIEAIGARKNKETKGHIALNVYEDKEEGFENIRFDVSDNGDGVPKEIVGQLFSDFINSTKPSGNGIGLVICKEIVDRHGGRIFLSETSETGSTFSLIIPLKDER